MQPPMILQILNRLLGGFALGYVVREDVLFIGFPIDVGPWSVGRHNWVVGRLEDVRK
jgi:hypothetical protein